MMRARSSASSARAFGARMATSDPPQDPQNDEDAERDAEQSDAAYNARRARYFRTR